MNSDAAYFLFGVSAKHLSDDVSTTVSQKVTTGSATWVGEKEVQRQRLEDVETARCSSGASWERGGC